MDEDNNPDDYMQDLPSLNSTLTKMIRGSRYVFSSDFLARGYPLDRMAAEKMWRIVCLPEEVTERDISLCIFRSNPDIGNRPEEPGIWRSEPDEADGVAFPFAADPNPDPEPNISSDSD